MFYWDYDLFYTQRISKHEAGEFIKRNLIDFPQRTAGKLFRHLPEAEKDTLYLRFHRKCTSPLPARMGKSNPDSHNADSQRKGKCHRALQRSPAPPRASLHPTGCAKRKYHYGIPIGANSGVQLHQRSYGITDQRTIDRIPDVSPTKPYQNIKTPLHPATIGSCHPSGTRADKTNRFYPLPSELKKMIF